MREPLLPPASGDPRPAVAGCRYIGEDGKACGAPRRGGEFSYCEPHHVICHLPPPERAAKYREFTALAEAVAANYTRWQPPTPAALKRIESRGALARLGARPQSQ